MSKSIAVRKAATLMLLRDCDSEPGFEVFMVERPGAAAFGGLHVFPGGKVDPADSVDAAHCSGLSSEEADAILGLERDGLAYWVAAIRESFEEAGVLFGHVDDELVDFTQPETAVRFDTLRHALQAGELKMSEMCHAERVVLAADRVHYFSHWMTPEGAPARFDTRFFVAAMPGNQSVAHHEVELEGGSWVSPAAALEHHRAGRWRMIHPTLHSLETLQRFGSVDELIAAVRVRRHLPEVTPEWHAQGMQYGTVSVARGRAGAGKPRG